jgi:Na+-translocating ferredoxin:NAD+ oxidoreductase RnfA subunit
MDNLLWIFISALLVNNFVLAYYFSACPIRSRPRLAWGSPRPS